MQAWAVPARRLSRTVQRNTSDAYQTIKESYDWRSGCRKLSIVLNPFVLLNYSYAPEVLCEADSKGAALCLTLLVWTLLVSGRAAALGALYTAALSGAVAQYALLQWVAGGSGARQRRGTSPGPAVKAAGEGVPLEGKRCCDVTPSVAEAGTETNGGAEAPGLAAVASALAFCAVPLAFLALVVHLVNWGRPLLLLVPAPSAYCTLLAACALLPHVSAPNAQRVIVLLPCGMLFTFLALLFML